MDRDVRIEYLFAVDSSGRLKVEGKKQDPIADTSTEIMLQCALQRRGLSMDQANLLDFKIHQLWVDRLIEVRLQTPPHGCAKTSFVNCSRQIRSFLKNLLMANDLVFEKYMNKAAHGKVL